MPKKKKARATLKKVKLTPKAEQLELTGEIELADEFQSGEEAVVGNETVAFGKSARRKKFNGELVVGALIETETLAGGKTRDIVVADYFSLAKGTIFMERSQHNPNIWYMNTKTEELAKEPAPKEYLVYLYRYEDGITPG